MKNDEDFKIKSPEPLCELIADMLKFADFWRDPKSPLSAHFTPAHPKVLFVAGENCSGKSYFVEYLRSWAKGFLEKSTTISISIRERTGAGSHEMGGMRRVMMFGNEEEQSTGATSVGVIERGFGNLPNRAEDGYRTLLVLDEPEIGLSAGYCQAMGTWLGQQINAMPAKTAGVVVVSHSRALALALKDVVGEPSFVHMAKPMDFATWASTPEQHTVEELLELRETGSRIRKAVYAFEEKQQDALNDTTSA